MKISDCKNILIIRLSSLGDIILTTPLVRSIKNLYPQINIDFIIRKEYHDTIKYNPYIRNIITLSRDYKSKLVREKIKDNNYDLIIDLQNNLRSRIISWQSSNSIVRYKKPYLKRLLLVKFKINRFKETIPIPVRYANTIPNFYLDDKGLELFLPQNKKAQLGEEKFIGLCPGSRHKTKMWPEEYFVELGNALNNENFKVVLFGGKDDMENCAKISEQIKNSLDFSNDNKLLELAVNMQKCKIIICNDSGLMHAALGLKIPTIAIFGSTVQEFGFLPYKGKKLVLENNSLTCRPCSHIGLDECPKEHLKCLRNIEPELVLQQTLKFIETL